MPNSIGFPEIYLSVILLSAGIIDYKKQKIPNYLTFPTVITALIYHFFLNGMSGVWFSLGGTFTGIALLIIPYAMGGMGAGDVKLLGAIGSFVGYISVVYVFLFTALFGGIYAVLVLVWHEKSLKNFLKKACHTVLSVVLTKGYKMESVESDNKSNIKPRLCYGIAIALGGFSYMGLTLYGYKLS
ncbi:prepilin peptidase [Desulfobacula sp.]|uniref:A24 family peptidase n=1 Tax=Desulfobacula sp. TaxID=2593537 RepID=UPI00261DFC42|nr:A24 family peptidase [Desulfobacula sp.]